MQMHAETISATCLRLVKNLSQIDDLKQFYLVGGTALSLQIGHRTSIDLDFFSPNEFNANSLGAELSTFKNFKNQFSNKKNIGCTIDGVKVEFLYFPYPNHFPLIEWNGIKMLSPIDIGLFKFLAILGRNRKKDIVDLYFIDKEVISISKLFKIFTEKYDNGDINLFKQIETLFDDEAIEQSDMPMMLTEFDWESGYQEVKSKVLKAVKNILDL